jgi:hypothetical protein
MEYTQYFYEIMDIILPALITLIGALVAWGLNEARKWLKTKTNNEAVLFALNNLDSVTQAVVAKINQSVKEAGDDGKITPEEALRIKDIALNEIKAQIPTSQKAILDKAIADLDKFVDAKVEETVSYLK